MSDICPYCNFGCTTAANQDRRAGAIAKDKALGWQRMPICTNVLGVIFVCGIFHL